MAGKILLHIPTSRNDRYGKQSPKCNCILNQDCLSHFKLKTLTEIILLTNIQQYMKLI